MSDRNGGCIVQAATAGDAEVLRELQAKGEAALTCVTGRQIRAFDRATITGPALPPLSAAAKEARKPLPPDVLADARQDTVHVEVGKARTPVVLSSKAAEAVRAFQERGTWDPKGATFEWCTGGEVVILNALFTATVIDFATLLPLLRELDGLADWDWSVLEDPCSYSRCFGDMAASAQATVDAYCDLPDECKTPANER